MKKVKSRHLIPRILCLSFSLFLSVSTFVFSQDSTAQDTAAVAETTSAPTSEAATAGDPAQGRELFNSLCAACHNLDNNSIGPPLRGITDKRDSEFLHGWIKNNQQMIASGDPTAIEVSKISTTEMSIFPQLTDADIDNILAYVSQPKAEPVAKAGGDASGSGTSGGGGISTNIILGILAFVLLMLLAVLFLVNKTLGRFAAASGVEIPVKEKRTPIWRSFVENQFLVLTSAIILFLLGTYFVFGWLMQVGVDQNYKPIQPIHFSHKIHAGDNQIDCKFCHSSARVSQTSGIPSLNVCMNCHRSIGEVAESTGTDEYSKAYYDAEIQKLYAATGWDPAAQDYTGEPQPVKWVRIHNLPDFAYFNHSQHVEVAGIQCQTCHGPVQEMEIMYQNAPLTMGWCISCHKSTSVKMEGSEYYEKIHEQLSEKYGVEEVTAAQLGGIECAKCHY